MAVIEHLSFERLAEKIAPKHNAEIEELCEIFIEASYGSISQASGFTQDSKKTANGAFQILISAAEKIAKTNDVEEKEALRFIIQRVAQQLAQYRPYDELKNAAEESFGTLEKFVKSPKIIKEAQRNNEGKYDIFSGPLAGVAEAIKAFRFQ